MRVYLFGKLVDPYPGCNYGKYWNWYLKGYGRGLFKAAIQELQEDLPSDPWWTGNDPDPLPE